MRLQSGMRTATDTTLRQLAMLVAIPVAPQRNSTRQTQQTFAPSNPICERLLPRES